MVPAIDTVVPRFHCLLRVVLIFPKFQCKDDQETVCAMCCIETEIPVNFNHVELNRIRGWSY
jgi:hypothetical protein